MKYFLFLFTSASLTLFSSIGKDANPNYVTTGNNLSHVPADTTISGVWLLQPVLASDTAAGRIPQLNFNLTTKKFTGNTGCNDMSGSFFIRKDSLAFNEHIISTRTMCQGYNEKAFVDNLTKTNHYKIVDGVLQLMNDQTILSKWTREADTKKSNKI
jgi:heat shock protein HslJ